MGFPIGRYHCTRCAFTQGGASDHKHRVYRLDDGSFLPIRMCTKWCCHCGGLRQAEDVDISNPLLDLERVSKELSSVTEREGWFKATWTYRSNHWLDSESSAATKLSADKLRKLGTQVDLCRKEISFLTARSEPARCLACGEQRRPAPDAKNGEEGLIPHPHCGGNLIYTTTGMINFGRQTSCQVHGPDGVFLCEEPLTPDHDEVFRTRFW